MTEFKVGDKVALKDDHTGLVGYEDEGYKYKVGDIFEVVDNLKGPYWIEQGRVLIEYVSESNFDLVESKIKEEKKSALDIQEGGGHYKSKGIQPVEYAYRNNLGFIESNVVKYVSRWKEKNGIQDLKKARHYLDILIEFEEQKEKQ